MTLKRENNNNLTIDNILVGGAYQDSDISDPESFGNNIMKSGFYKSEYYGKGGITATFNFIYASTEDYELIFPELVALKAKVGPDRIPVKHVVSHPELLVRNVTDLYFSDLRTSYKNDRDWHYVTFVFTENLGAVSIAETSDFGAGAAPADTSETDDGSDTMDNASIGAIEAINAETAGYE